MNNEILRLGIGRKSEATLKNAAAPFETVIIRYFQDNWTALLNACKEGHAEAVSALIDHGADIEHRDIVRNFLFYKVDENDIDSI